MDAVFHPFPEGYRPGTIVSGNFERDDGTGNSKHYAVIVALRSGIPVAVMGTSLKVAEELVRRRPALLVISPRCASQHWLETGLVKPTLFDLEAGKRISLLPAYVGNHRVKIEGTVENVGAWRRLMSICSGRKPD